VTDYSEYERAYLANYKYERQNVRYRRQNIIEALRRYGAKHILEVGCGLDPVFLDYQSFDSMTVVEPRGCFYARAAEAAAGRPAA
jgi:hypothetical protein